MNFSYEFYFMAKEKKQKEEIVRHTISMPLSIHIKLMRLCDKERNGVSRQIQTLIFNAKSK
jgi:hypothetical protein